MQSNNRRIIPTPTGSSYGHMVLSSREKCLAVINLLQLLTKLDVINNPDVFAIPIYHDGETDFYIHT